MKTAKVFFSVVLGVLFWCVPANANSLSTILDRVEFENASLFEVVEYFRERSVTGGSEVNIILDSRVDPEQKITLYLSRISIGNALLCLLDHAGLEYRKDTHAVFIVPSGEGAPPSRTPYPREEVAGFPSAVLASNTEFDGVEFSDMPIKDVVKYISSRSDELDPDKGGINLVFSNYIDGNLPISLKLNQVPVSRLLFRMSQVSGVEIRLEPYAICIDPPGTTALRAAKWREKNKDKIKAAQALLPKKYGMRSPEFTIGTYPDDPRSPTHPDYVHSGHPDRSKRTNALNNVYKWVGGKWTFVRYGSGGDAKAGLDAAQSSLRTSSLEGGSLD